MRKPIAFIGSRDISQFPTEWLELYDQAVERCVKNGFKIRSGAAPGSDQRATTRALEVGGSVELVLPYPAYECDWMAEVMQRYPGKVAWEVYNPKNPAHDDWARSVREYHPAPDRLTMGGFALHARNYGIIKPVLCVVALPGIGKEGGTGQGLRIARGLEIPTYNLTLETGRQALVARFAKPT